MIEKYQHMMDKVHQYIYNSIQIEDDNLIIAREILEKFPAYVAFFKCDTEMIQEFLLQMTKAVRLATNTLEKNYEAKIENLNKLIGEDNE